MTDGQQQLDGLSMMSAVLSDDGLYRYSLHRVWDVERGIVNFIGLNPSTADHRVDDATIRRCMRFARDWGYGGLVMTNLFALRATDPRVLRQTYPAIALGPLNDGMIDKAAREAKIVVCAWGADSFAVDRARVVAERLAFDGLDLRAIRLTADGRPGHPLYLPAHLTPEPWTP